jgi:hypothetical protein
LWNSKEPKHDGFSGSTAGGALSPVLTVRSRERILAVTPGGQASKQEACSLPGVVLQEPANRGSAPGIFLVAAYLLACDPEAVALFMPSTHQFVPGQGSQTHLATLALVADSLEDQMVVLGAIPTRAKSGLGWLEPGQTAQRFSGIGARSIIRCHERPSEAQAKLFLRNGYFWNTMVMAAKVSTLWRIGRQLFGSTIMGRFDNLLELLKLVLAGKAGPELETLALRDVYRGLETVNFWRPLLERAAAFLLVLPGDEARSGSRGHELTPAAERESSGLSQPLQNSA